MDGGGLQEFRKVEMSSCALRAVGTIKHQDQNLQSDFTFDNPFVQGGFGARCELAPRGSAAQYSGVDVNCVVVEWQRSNLAGRWGQQAFDYILG
jgi:hypothetical protein